MAIPAIAASVAPLPVAPTSSPSSGAGGFGATLDRLVQSVEASGAEANQAVERMLSGEGDVHSALIAMQHADTTFQLTVQIRNKIVQAYQDIMRMPV